MTPSRDPGARRNPGAWWLSPLLAGSLAVAGCAAAPPAADGPDGGAVPDAGESLDAGEDLDGGAMDGGLTPREQAALGDEPLQAPRLAPTASSIGHFSLARQASTFRAGPEGAVEVQVLDFEAVSGVPVGISPWHVVSATRYPGGARAVWGVDLRYVYKVVVDGPRFELADTFEVNAGLTSIPWNLAALSDGRVVVPDPDGFTAGDPTDPCRTEGPSFLAFSDDPTDASSPIRCERALALGPQRLRDLCGVGPAATLVSGSGTNLGATFTGELVTVVTYEGGDRPGTYAVVFDDQLTTVEACTFIDEADITNQVAAELIAPDVSALYYATDAAMVKLTYHHAARALDRVWERPVAVRGRIGTTPTILDAPGGDRLLVVVDAPCAVISVPNGLIACDTDTSPARLVGIRREDTLPAGEPEVFSAELPAFIRTVENSPAVRRDMVVVANYSGYLPRGLKVPPGGAVPTGGPGAWGASPDAVADFASGIAAVRYAPERDTFDLVWADGETQVSGVPTISAGANLVYGTGAEEADGRLYLYGFLLEADDRGPAGTRVLREDLGRAPFPTPRRDVRGNLIYLPSEYRPRPGELFDAGNNLLVLEDGSLLFPGGRALARMRALGRAGTVPLPPP